MDITTPPPAQLEATSYTIESLLQKAGVYGQQKVFAKIDGIVRVKGIVIKINRYQYATYLVLKDRELQITVKCDSKQQVYEGSSIVVEGMLLLKPSTYYSGLECYIDGNIVGSWELTNAPTINDYSILKKARFISLDDLLAEDEIFPILLLGTDIAINDVMSQLRGQATSILNPIAIRVGRADTLIGDLKDAGIQNYRAFVIARGGDDNTMELWNDPSVVSFLLSHSLPYYTALGHSHSRTLADQYADGSYHTPTAFGTAINSIIARKKKFKEIESEYSRLKQEYVLLASASRMASAPVKPPTDWVKLTAVFSIYTVALYFIFKAIG